MKVCHPLTIYDYLVQCPEEINVFAQLLPATQYTWTIEDKFLNTYSGAFITDAQGFWSIPVVDLPAGLLTQYSGGFNLKVFGADMCAPEKFKVAKVYDTIRFEVKAGNFEKNNLGCDFDCITEGPAVNTPAIFPFTSGETLTIPWTSLLQSIYGNQVTVQVWHEVSPNTYQNVTGNVVVQENRSAYELLSIYLDNGGPATGYIMITN